VLPDEVLDEWRGLDAILLGAVGDPAPVWPARPAWSSAGSCCSRCASPSTSTSTCARSACRRGIDFEVIRENTEGTYAGEGGFLRKDTAARDRHPGFGQHPHRRRALRALRVRAGRPHRAPAPHLVHKKNVLTFAGDLWQRTFDEVAAEYPQVAPATTTSTPPASTSSSDPSATT
jgi:3-isopropylmalate dehydrogenase